MKKVLILLVLISTLFLSSCIKMDSNLVINDDLSFQWKTVFDYTKLNSMVNWIWDSFSTWSSTKKPKESVCDQLKSWTGWLSMWMFDNPVCKDINENVAEVSWKWDSLKKDIKIKDWNYYLSLWSVVESNSKDTWKSNNEKEQQILWLKNMWFEMNYTIEFPSKILESNVWKFEWKVLKFNIFDIIDKSNPYAIFKNNWNLDIIKNASNEKISIIIEKKSLFFKKIILAKKDLEKTYNWRINIIKYNKIIPKLNDYKLVEIYNKLSNVNFNSYKFLKYKNRLSYLYAKIGLEIYKRKNIIKWTIWNYNNLYEESTKKTRDLDRIENIISLSTTAEMYFMNEWSYPETLWKLLSYYEKTEWTLPNDILKGKSNSECTYWYKYKTFNYNNFENGWYKLSTCLEELRNNTHIYSKWTK